MGREEIRGADRKRERRERERERERESERERERQGRDARAEATTGVVLTSRSNVYKPAGHFAV